MTPCYKSATKSPPQRAGHKDWCQKNCHPMVHCLDKGQLAKAQIEVADQCWIVGTRADLAQAAPLRAGHGDACGDFPLFAKSGILQVASHRSDCYCGCCSTTSINTGAGNGPSLVQAIFLPPFVVVSTFIFQSVIVTVLVLGQVSGSSNVPNI